MKKRLLVLAICMVGCRAQAQDANPQLRDPFADPFAPPGTRSPTNAHRIGSNIRQSFRVRVGEAAVAPPVSAPIVSAAKPYAIDSGGIALVRPGGAAGEMMASGWATLPPLN